MTQADAKRVIYRKCKHCKWWSCAVWSAGEPLEDDAMCVNHRAWRDADEDACKSFDYADWIIRKTVNESEVAQ